MRKKFLRGTLLEPFANHTSYHFYLDLNRHNAADIWKVIGESKIWAKRRHCVLDPIMHTMKTLL